MASSDPVQRTADCCAIASLFFAFVGIFLLVCGEFKAAAVALPAAVVLFVIARGISR